MKIKKMKFPDMSGKRSATTDLNHDNWDKEEEAEEKGVFKTAPEEELQNRVIKKAKRRVAGETSGNTESKSIFSGFTGFTSSASTTGSTLSATGSASPFSFLSKITPKGSTSAAVTTDNKDLASGDALNATTSTFPFEKSNTYYAKLKGLNQAVTSWIKKHVDENPLCILTPIFQDYEKYLKEIEQDKQTGPAGSSFSFGTTTSSNGNDKVVPAENKEAKDSNSFKFTSTSPGKIASTESAKPATAASSLFSFLKTDAPTTSSTTAATFSFGGQKTEASTVTSSSSPNFSFSQKTSATSEASKPSTGLFSFAPTTSATASSTAGFSFSGTGKPFTFGASVAKPESSNETPKEQVDQEEEDQPPKVDFKPVVEEDSVYSKKCKVFVKQGTAYADRGIGTLYLKPVKDSEKTQLLVRADTNLGNILLNLILNESIPAQRMGKNNVMIVCIPTPESEQKPTPVLLRVKTGEEADELLETINKYKK